MSARKELLAKANPNQHGNIRLYRYTETYIDSDDSGGTRDGETVFVVCLPGEDSREGDGAEFCTEAEARAHYDAEVKRLASAPNWGAQARYDAQWGTDNGYAPYQRRDY